MPRIFRETVSPLGLDILKAQKEEKFIKLQHDAEFQLQNVEGWMSAKDYECALIKARCLVDVLNELVLMARDINTR